MSFQPQSQLEQIYAASFSDDWNIATLKALEKAFTKAEGHCRPPDFGPQEAKDLRSHYCRAIFENEWRKLSNKFSGVQAESRLNKGGSYSHTWVQAGNLFLTASSVANPHSKPRQADFRTVYAENGQLNLFGQVQPPEAFYAILLYGPPQASSPAFVTIAFPSKQWNTFVERIDLLARYPGVIGTPVLRPEPERVQKPTVQPIRVSPEEKIQAPQKPRIRNPRKKTGEERA